MNYAKINDTSLSYLKEGEFGRTPIKMVHDSVLRKQGYLPVKGEPEKREGYNAVPSEWHVEVKTIKRKGLKQQLKDVLDKDGNKIGEKECMVECEEDIDNSYIQIDAWDYEQIKASTLTVHPNDKEFRKACRSFRSVCAQMGEFLGEEDFKGGFEDYDRFINSDKAKKSQTKASMLASMWNGANEYTKYEGSKIGLRSPQWWYRCWEYTEEELGEVNEQ